MLTGAIPSAVAMVGTAVFRIMVSRDYVTVGAGPRYNKTADFHEGVRGFCVPHAA
jgi:hypothetical protein